MTKAHRVFICCDVSFPHGQAAANYVRSLSFLLRDAGHLVTVIGYLAEIGKRNIIGNEITFRPYNESNGKLSKLSSKIFAGRSCVQVLKDLGLNRQDVIIYYASNNLFAAPVMHYAHKIGCRVCACVVEWHQKFEYKYGGINPRWISNKLCFEKTNCKADLVLPISKNIEAFYQSKGCCTQRLLPLVDTRNVVPDLNRNAQNGVVQLYYSGNPVFKDDIQSMFEGILLLDQHEREHVKMFLMGVSRQDLEFYLPQLRDLLNSLDDVVTILGWLEYSELMKVYDQLDYLFLARIDNPVNRANYPSKVPEAMTRGIAVVGSQTGDYWCDLKDGSDSILFQKSSPESCRDALKRIISLNEAEKAEIRKNARLTAESKYDYRKWLHVAESIVGAE